MKRLNRKPQDLKMFECPQCQKYRMIRPLGHVVNVAKHEYKTRDNSQIELFTDICDACKKRNWRLYFEPTKTDVRRVLNAIQNDASIGNDASLEDLL